MCSTMQNVNDLSEPVLHWDPFKFDTSAGWVDSQVFPASDEESTKLITRRGILFTTTGLRNLHYSAASLKSFGSLFTNDINRQAREHGPSESYKVELEPLVTVTQHPHPLKITVQRLSEKTQCVFVGVFFPWRTIDIDPCQGYLNMSYLFVIGSRKFVLLMNDLFQKYFDCKIAPIVYTQNEIKWLLAIMTHCVDELTSSNIFLKYQMNFDSSKLDFIYSLSDLKKIWDNIHDKTEDVIKHEEVLRFCAAIDEHVLESSSLDLSHYLLKRFSIPRIITLDSDGKIDCGKLEAFHLVCRFIEERRSC